MKVLVFAPYAGWSPHWETDLEIIETRLLAGDEVTVVGCGRDYERCDINPEQSFTGCLNCIGRRRAGMRKLSEKVAFTTIGKLSTPEDRERARAASAQVGSFAEARSLMLDNFDWGMASLSSLFSLCRDSDPDYDEFRPILGEFLRASALTYLVMQRHIESLQPDHVYLFNGRHAILRAVLRACERHDVPYCVHDRGSTLKHYVLTSGSMVQGRQTLAGRVDRSWNESPHTPAEREEIAHAWYERRARGVISNWVSYTEQQDSGQLPANWDATRRNVTIFNSSDDEFAALGEEWENPLFEDQTVGLSQILERLQTVDHSLHLYIRMHPNLTGVDNGNTRALLKLNLPFVDVIAPESQICSYSLMRASEKVMTFGSTAGIEATYWDRPSILAGQSAYRHLGATHNPTDLDELILLLFDRELGPCDKTGAIKYGYDLATFGESFQFFEPDGVFAGLFKGKRIEPRGVDRLKLKLIRSAQKRWRRLSAPFRRAG